MSSVARTRLVKQRNGSDRRLRQGFRTATKTLIPDLLLFSHSKIKASNPSRFFFSVLTNCSNSPRPLALWIGCGKYRKVVGLIKDVHLAPSNTQLELFGPSHKYAVSWAILVLAYRFSTR